MTLVGFEMFESNPTYLTWRETQVSVPTFVLNHKNVAPMMYRLDVGTRCPPNMCMHPILGVFKGNIRELKTEHCFNTSCESVRENISFLNFCNLCIFK